ncbi:hypothetical protein HFZ77_15160 [Thalassovita gelatinovora]|nr:hypothetical protein HFZ77_15160 [Thalassovita gelatinovora]
MRDSIVSQLKQQGYEQIAVSRTWLGRTRILAERGSERREIIINPRTGEILRDFWRSDAATGAALLAHPEAGARSGGGSGGGADASGDDSGDDDSGDDSGDDDSGDDGGDDSGGDGEGDSGDGDSGDGDGDSGDSD